MHIVSEEEEIESWKGILGVKNFNSEMYHIVPAWDGYKACAPYLSQHGCKLYSGSMYKHIVGRHSSQLNWGQWLREKKLPMKPY